MVWKVDTKKKLQGIYCRLTSMTYVEIAFMSWSQALSLRSHGL